MVTLARQETGEAEVSEEVEQGIQRARGGGQGLDHGIRGQMEAAFGTDFGNVRVHTGTEADRLNRAVSARAFTTGSDVFFRNGEYNPGSSSGRELLAHELTHVVQQGKDTRAKLTVNQPGDRFEQEADEMARAVSKRDEAAPSAEEDRGVGAELSEPEGGSEVASMAEEGEIVGTLPDILSPQGEPEKGAGFGNEDFPLLRSAGASGLRVEPRIGLAFSHPVAPGLAGSARDSATGEISPITFSQPGGLTIDSPFGSENYEPAFEGISFSVKDGVCTIKATLHVKCPWGVNDGGRVDVPAATDPVVTRTSWPTIFSDLTPSTVSPHKSPRTTYWSKALCERHEKFHGTEDYKWTSTAGSGLVKAKIEAATINPANAATQVHDLLDDCLRLLRSENIKWYKGSGASHDEYAGEIQAYADGRPHYQALANGVEKQGRSLEAAAGASPSAPAAAGKLAALSTVALMNRYTATTDNAERAALQAEMATRNALVYIKVLAPEESEVDEVYVLLSHDGRSVRSAVKDMRINESTAMLIPLGSLSPIFGRINVKVFDEDWLDADDLIVHMDWIPSFGEMTNTRSWEGANYQVSIKFDR